VPGPCGALSTSSPAILVMETSIISASSLSIVENGSQHEHGRTTEAGPRRAVHR
jgi:hypothetical protein